MRLCSLRMRGKFNNFTIISVHELTEEKYELIKKSFYDKLNHIYQRIQSHDAKILVGDFNARIGRGLKTNYRKIEPTQDIK